MVALQSIRLRDVMGLDFMHKNSGSFDVPMFMILSITSRCRLIIPSEAGNKSALCLLDEYLLQLSSLTYLFPSLYMSAKPH